MQTPQVAPRSAAARTACVLVGAAALLGCVREPLRVAGAAQLAATVERLGFEADAAVLVAAGDIASCRRAEAAAATARVAGAALAAFASGRVLTLGDHAYPRATPARLQDCYGPTWGALKARTAPTPGNHDYVGDGDLPYHDYFDFFAANPAARERGFYGFDLGAWRIVSLNSNLEVDETAAQLAWLAEDLQAADAACIVAYWHHPVFSSSLHGVQKRDAGRGAVAFWEVLERHGADLILNGHAHMYERFARQSAAGVAADSGIRQIVVGTGGASLDLATARRNHSEYLNNEQHGVLVVALHDASYEWAFIGVDGVVYDRSSAPVGCS
jgi:3',5'-cyclic AMP phosphodiesterase CpdA